MRRGSRELVGRLHAFATATGAGVAVVVLISSGAGRAGSVEATVGRAAAEPPRASAASARADVRVLHAHANARPDAVRSQPQTRQTPPPPSERTVVFALGDGADGSASARRLAEYVAAQKPDRFFYLGDVYENGTAAEFASKYEPLYGSLAAKTDPVIGNHEYANRNTGYYPYWTDKRGWTREQAKHRAYVDAASGWQIIAYSSETDMAAEAKWVASQVAEHPGTCRIAIAHKGRHVVVDTGHDDNVDQEPVWRELVDRTAINLVAHNHVYGRLEPLRGVTVIVSGAGRRSVRSLGPQHHAVAASATGVATATRLVLRRGAADFGQVDADGTVYDSGTIACEPAP